MRKNDRRCQPTALHTAYGKWIRLAVEFIARVDKDHSRLSFPNSFASALTDSANAA